MRFPTALTRCQYFRRISHSDQAEEVVAECSNVCRRRSSTDAMGFARKSSGEQVGSLLSVISFSDLNVGSGINRIPKSNALPMYLNLRDVLEIRTVIFGNCCRNSDNRGISQRRAKLVGTLIRTIPARTEVPPSSL